MGTGTRLVGREGALAVAQAALDEASGGAGQLLLVSGEPGIGKTALLAEVARRAASRGARVLRGSGWDGDGAPAYWPWVQVVRGIAELDGRGELGEARRLLPGADLPAPGVAEPGEARFGLFDAVARLLTWRAGEAPLVVALDDLQWADEASLRLLEFVAHHMTAAPVLLLGAYRDNEAGSGLQAVASAGQTLPLGGLDGAGVAALMAAVAGSAPPEPVAADVHRRSGGNPFLVRETTRLLLAQGGLAAAGAARSPVAGPVRDTLERRLARLSQPCVDVLAASAVAGPDVRPELLVRMGHDEAGLGELLDEAVRAGVLRPPERLLEPHRFVHDLFRETVLAAQPAATRARLHLAAAKGLEAMLADGVAVHPAELSAHFAAAGPAAAADTVRYARLAAEEADARLGFEEACRQLELAVRALDLLDGPRVSTRLAVLLALARARNRAGDGRAARTAYLQATDLARRHGERAALAGAALGMHGLGARSGGSHAESIALLDEAAAALDDPSALRSRVLASLAREVFHEQYEPDVPRAAEAAEEAVAVARAAGEPGVLAFALLALHDVRWRPGSAPDRLPILEEMLAAAGAAGERDLTAEAHLLRATALIELGDPAGRAELAGYVRLAADLGHARGRWAALTRQATLAGVVGRLDEADRLSNEALALGLRIGEPDALGVYGTLRAALVLLGGDVGKLGETALIDSVDPVVTMKPVLRAVALLGTGDIEAARAAVAGFSVGDAPRKHDLEMPAIMATVLAPAGSDDQRAQVYRQLEPNAGRHVVVGGCASYWGAVDHHLGALAAALGRTGQARVHLEAAVAMHERLGAAAWTELSRAALDRLGGGPAGNVFRRDGDVWSLGYAGCQVHLADAKGLRDIATLLAAPGRPVSAFDLLGVPEPGGADPVLDRQAVAAYRARLADLDAELEEAESWADRHRAERARAERDALVAELSGAAGLGGRRRRLGDASERARKTVTARIRDSLGRIERAHPALGTHLRASIRTGTSCSYTPDEPIPWKLL